MIFIFTFVVGILLGYAFAQFELDMNLDDCPRAYLGYSCRGKKCDHSREAWKDVTTGEKKFRP